MIGACVQCGKVCKESSKAQMKGWVWCPKCKIYTVPKVRSV